MIVIPLALIGACDVGACGVKSKFDLNASAQIVAAFTNRDRPASEFSPTLASGSWTVDEVHARLDEVEFEFQGRRIPLWSRAVLFAPYRSATEFIMAGVLDPVTARALAARSWRDEGSHLVVFDAHSSRTIIAEVFLSVEGMAAGVVVFDSKDPDR